LASIAVAWFAFVAGAAPLHTLPGITTSIELKIFGIAFAVGLDVLALSIAIGIMKSEWGARLRLGLAFSSAEVIMQVVGYGLGTGVGRIVGTITSYLGFVVLAGVGFFIIRESYATNEMRFDVDSGWGLVAASASISLDSLGIGVSLPGVPLPLGPLLVTVACSTVLFTAVGLTFGSRLGERYKRIAGRCAGIVLIVLAIVFTGQHLAGWAP
jgi:putative Mn2+ efflux pump MntP